ncbi:hypothetical protein BH09ACT1_BH09ACT1_16790 [soil metagenome]
MAMSRKRVKELKRLRSAASDLWDQQRDVLDYASKVTRESGRQAMYLGREEVAPRVKDTYDSRVKPAVRSGASAARDAAGSAKFKLTHDVIPTVATSLGSIAALRAVANDPHVREALAKVAQTGSAVSSRFGDVVPTKKKSAGPGRYILIALGLVGVASLAYAAYQTLRADDELWVTDDPEPTDATPPAASPSPDV